MRRSIRIAVLRSVRGLPSHAVADSFALTCHRLRGYELGGIIMAGTPSTDQEARSRAAWSPEASLAYDDETGRPMAEGDDAEV